MAKNVKIAGASYSDVPAIEVPTVTGGTARFIDEDMCGGGDSLRHINLSECMKTGVYPQPDEGEIWIEGQYIIDGEYTVISDRNPFAEDEYYIEIFEGDVVTLFIYVEDDKVTLSVDSPYGVARYYGNLVVPNGVYTEYDEDEEYTYAVFYFGKIESIYDLEPIEVQSKYYTQTLIPSGTGFSEVTVKPVDSGGYTIKPTSSGGYIYPSEVTEHHYFDEIYVEPVPTEQKTVTENGTYTPTDGKWFDSVTVNVEGQTPIYDTPSIDVSAGGLITASANGKSNTEQLTTQSGKTVTPTESEQTVVNGGVFTTGAVKVGAISKTYVGSEVTRRSSTDLSVNGATVTVPTGYYPTQQTKSVASGTAGTPSATKGTVNNHQVTITPTVTNTTGYITGGTKTGTAVTVKASDLVSGSETKTSNGTYDVTNLAELVVNVSGGGGGLPSGLSALAFGQITVSSDFTTTRQTFNHTLGTTPDLMIVWAPSNIATTYSMLFAIRGTQVNWRGGNYSGHMAYHGNSTSTVTWTNANSTSYGISNMTATTFQLASSSSSYYWRKGTYNYLAIKFS